MTAPERITARDNPLLVRLRKLSRDPGGYRRTGELWLEGEHLCQALVNRQGRPAIALLTDAAWARPGLHTLASLASRTVLLPETLFAGLSSLESPAAIGFVWRSPTPPSILPDVPTVVLDRLQDAGNVGSILRSAAALGVRQVLALHGTAALWSPKVLRAGMGAHFGLRLVELLDLADLDVLTVPLLGTSSHSAQRLHACTLPQPCAWVLGHEGQGVQPELLARCAQVLGIAQPGGEESLNVAAAAAVCLHEALRQRLGQ